MSKSEQIKIIHAASREVTEGKIYDVIEWDDQHNPKVKGNLGPVIVVESKWVPAETDPEFKWGEKVLVRDTSKGQWFKRIFVGLNPHEESPFKYFVAREDLASSIHAYKFCKKANQYKDFDELTLEEIQEAYKAGEITYNPKDHE